MADQDDAHLTAGTEGSARYAHRHSEEELYPDSHQHRPTPQVKHESREQTFEDQQLDGHDIRREGATHAAAAAASAHRQHQVEQTRSLYQAAGTPTHAATPAPAHSTPLLSLPTPPAPSSYPTSSHDDGGQTPKKVYVENLPLPTSESVLTDLFASYGTIQRIHIGSDRGTGKQLGFAFVEYTEDSMGQNAIAAMNGREVTGRFIRCSVAKKKARVDQSAPRNTAPPQQPMQMPMQMQMQAPPPMMQMVPMMGPNGQMMMGSVAMPMQPMMPIVGGPGTSLLGTPVTAASSSSSHKDHPPPPGPNVFINGIPFSWDESDLMKLFSPFGAISHTKMLVDPATGKTRGQAFIHFDSQNASLGAIAAWHGKKPPGCDTFLQVRFAYPKKGEPGATAAPVQQQAMQQGMPMMPMMQMGMQPMQPVPMQMAYPADPYGSPPPLQSFAQQQQHHQPSAQSEESSYGPDRKSRTHASGQRHNPLARPSPASTQSTASSESTSVSVSGSAPGVTCLFVFYLPKNTSKEELSKLFSLYGSVADVSIPIDRASGETKGFAFVNMNSLSAAENAIQNLNGFQLNGKRLKVSFKGDRAAGSGASGTSGAGGARQDSQQPTQQQQPQHQQQQQLLPQPQQVQPQLQQQLQQQPQGQQAAMTPEQLHYHQFMLFQQQQYMAMMQQQQQPAPMAMPAMMQPGAMMQQPQYPPTMMPAAAPMQMQYPPQAQYPQPQYPPQQW